jgi:hypothetical protein
MQLALAVLVDPAHRLPMPGGPRLFSAATGESVDLDLPEWAALIADGSIRVATSDDLGAIASANEKRLAEIAAVDAGAAASSEPAPAEPAPAQAAPAAPTTGA